jgi:ATP-dependent Clp protease ATP-binding subunit ClpA
MTETRTDFGAAASRAFHAAHREALRRGRRSVEAEHLLLALAAEHDTVCGRFLHESGLGEERLADALERESIRSLAYAGVTPLPESEVVLDRRGAPDGRRGPVRLGASARSAIQAGMRASAMRHRSRRATDLLVGILSAELGTVPRALALAGIDRDGLLSALDEQTANRVAE